MILSKKDEIVAIAKIYIEKYNISPLDAIKYAMKVVERRLEENERN